MKWGRKKSANPSSSSPPISMISRVFSVSWFSKSKLKPEMNNKSKTAFEFPTPKSSGCRFYSMDEDDSFWRLSFREERIEGRRSTGGINPLWNDRDYDYDFKLPVPDFDAKLEVSTEQEECRNFNQMVSDIRKTRNNAAADEVFRKFREEKNLKTGERCKQRNNAADGEVSRKFREEKNSSHGEKCKQRNNAAADEVSRKFREEKNSNSGERVIFPVKEIKIKSKSINRGAKLHSPRTECRIRAIEEMKKGRTKKKEKEKVVEGSSVFDSCAVAKSSFDPERDFRDSMVEMIREKGIGRAEDLEQLLACYLTLNRDEYHDLIIKVFRRVWFELKGPKIDHPVQNRVYFDY